MLRNFSVKVRSHPHRAASPRRLGGGVGGLLVRLVRGRRDALVLVMAGAGRGRGLADPATDAVDQFLATGGLGVAHVRYEPELLGFPGRHEELARVLGREEVELWLIPDMGHAESACS